MRFVISLSSAGNGWETRIASDQPGWAAAPRLLRKGAKGYPHPPDGETSWDDWSAGACADMSDAPLARLHRRIVAGDPDPATNDVEQFGGYLGAVLLGPWWHDVVAAVPAGPIEFELALDAGDPLLQGLPWEMAMLAGSPLAALPEPGRRVAFTRVVQSKRLAEAKPIELPLRVLFVVGAQWDDALRPGAEYFALLRQFGMNPEAAGSLGAALHTRLLLEATREKLQDAIDDFHPSVVHVIAHGEWNDSSAALLLTRDDRGAPGRDPVTAVTFAGLLLGRTGTAPPVQAVVLNACHTGEPDDSYTSFAAALVMSGVPIAIGMSGEVADSVCRIFTRAFYRGLIEAKDLGIACAEGRRAAVLFFGLYTKSVEWARPVLFRAAGAPLIFTANQQQIARGRAVGAFRQRGEREVLCGRMPALLTFQDLCAAVRRRAGAVNLAFEVTQPEAAMPGPGERRPLLGKTWLLNELTAQAVLEGFIPCLIPSGPGFEPPANLALLAIRIAEAMNVTRGHFGLPERATAEAHRLAFALLNQVPADANYDYDVARAKDALRRPRPDGGVWADQNSARAAIRADFAALQRDVEPGALPMLFIDDLHRYEGVALPLLAALGPNGLGTAGAPIPVVFTYATREKGGLGIVDALRGREGAIRRAELAPFLRPHETTLAYRQYYLAQNLVPSSLKIQSEQFTAVLKDWFEEEIKGVPSFLCHLVAPTQLRILRAAKMLIDADDEDILSSQRGRDG